MSRKLNSPEQSPACMSIDPADLDADAIRRRLDRIGREEEVLRALLRVARRTKEDHVSSRERSRD